MKKRNKIVTLIVVLLFSFTMLFACGKEKKEDITQNDVGEENQTTETPSKAIDEEESEATKAPETTETVEQSKEEQTSVEAGEQQEIRDISSIELVKEIKIGWNLGNTFDATDGSGVNSETSWGNPLTSKEIFDAIKAAGFNTVRIPTTWQKHLGPAPDYTIEKEWLDRVQEVVDYAMANEMFAILNMHHEEWHFPSNDNAEVATEILTKVWKQIADRFQNYDEHLIFEGLNEPRMKGTNVEWTGGNPEAREVVNQFNTAFVETIRSSGGNNPLRHLMIPPYAASNSPNAWQGFNVPEDNKIIVSIHAYTPYQFTLNKTGTSTWGVNNANDTNEIDYLMTNIKNNFVSKGIPVIIGEFGAMDKSENLESRVAWAEYYIKKATENDIPCIWWDNGGFSGTGELFGLLNRRDFTWKYPEVVEALMKGLK